MRVEDILESCAEIDCKVRIIIQKIDNIEAADVVEVSNYHDAPALARLDDKIKKMDVFAESESMVFKFIREDPMKKPVLIIYAFPIWECSVDDVECTKTGCISNGGPCKNTTRWEDSRYFKEDYHGLTWED